MSISIGSDEVNSAVPVGAVCLNVVYDNSLKGVPGSLDTDLHVATLAADEEASGGPKRRDWSTSSSEFCSLGYSTELIEYDELRC